MKRRARVNPSGSLMERFQASYIPEPNSGCWLWDGAFAPARGKKVARGTICHQKKRRQAHRVAFELFKGPIPEGLFVCHRCDVSLCVNPAHLYAGTRLDNAADAVARGRHRSGERHPGAKLTAEKVRAIRVDSRSDTVVAAEYGVTPKVIWAVKRRQKWAHVQ